MMHTNTDKKRRNYSHLLLWSKVVFVVLFFLCQNSLAQITLSEGATIYVEQNTAISGIKNISNSEDEIFLASGAIIYHSDSGKKNKSIQQKPSKIKEESALKIAQIQKQKKQKEKIASIKIPVSQKKEFFSTQKSDESFASDYNFSSNSVPIPTYQLKDFLDEKYESSIFLSKLYVFGTYFYTVEDHKKQFQLSYFTRPPPYFV